MIALLSTKQRFRFLTGGCCGAALLIESGLLHADGVEARRRADGDMRLG